MRSTQEALSFAGVVSARELVRTQPLRVVFDGDRVLVDTERYKRDGVLRPYDSDHGALEKFLRIAGGFTFFSEEHEVGLQQRKLEGLGIAHLFPQEDRHIVVGDKITKLDEVIAKYRTRGELIVLFDDRIDIVSRAKLLGVHLPVWIRRGPHAIDALASGHDFRPFAQDLNAAFDIVYHAMASRIRPIIQPSGI